MDVRVYVDVRALWVYPYVAPGKEIAMTVSATKLRENIYQILDEVLETGVPVEVERKGKILRIVPPEPKRKLLNLERRPDFLKCDPDEIVHLDWSEEWRP
jgi:antitoxin (DNA-binding transcriptional repressor) of toxin-antitoxin stability system